MRLLSLFSGNLIHTPVVLENSRPGLLKKHGFSNMIGVSLIVFGFVFGSLTARAEVDLKEQVKILNKSKSIKDMTASLKRIFKRPEDHRQINKDAKKMSKMAAGSKWKYEVKGKDIAFMVNGRVLFTFRPVDAKKGKFLFNGHKFVINSRLSYKQNKAQMSKVLRRQTAGLEQFFIDKAHAGWLFGKKVQAAETALGAGASAMDEKPASVIFVESRKCKEGYVFKSDVDDMVEQRASGPEPSLSGGKCIKNENCKGEVKKVTEETGAENHGVDETFQYKKCVMNSAGAPANDGITKPEPAKKCLQNEQDEKYKMCVGKNQEKRISEIDEKYRNFILNYGHFKKENSSSGSSSPETINWEDLGLRDCSEVKDSSCITYNQNVASSDTDEGYEKAIKGCMDGYSVNVVCRRQAKTEFEIRKKQRQKAIASGSAGAGNSGDKNETKNYEKCLEQKIHLGAENSKRNCSKPGYAKLATHPELFHLGHRLPLLVKKSVHPAPDERGPVFNHVNCIEFATDDAEKTKGWGMTDKAADQYCKIARELHLECVEGAKNCNDTPATPSDDSDGDSSSATETAS